MNEQEMSISRGSVQKGGCKNLQDGGSPKSCELWKECIDKPPVLLASLLVNPDRRVYSWMFDHPIRSLYDTYLDPLIS